MSELRVESEVDPSSWNASLRACHGTAFHAAQWADYVQAEQPGAHAHFYSLLDDDGAVCAMAVGFRATSSRGLAAAFAGRRWLDAQPALRDVMTASASQLVCLIEEHARRAGDVSLHLGSFASPGSEGVIKPLGFSLRRRYEFELALTREEKSLWESIDIRRRQRIRKAMKAGVEVRELAADEGVSHLRQLQAESLVRIVARGGPPSEDQKFAGDDPVAILTRGELGRVVGGFVHGVCVSACLFTSFNGMAYYTLSGHDAKGLQTSAPSLVLWEMALRFKGEGIQRLNLGGCGIDAVQEASPEHGVYAFKKSFGGDIVECANGDKVLRPVVLRATNFLKAALR